MGRRLEREKLDLNSFTCSAFPLYILFFSSSAGDRTLPYRFVNRDDIDFGLAHDLPAVQTLEMVRDSGGVEVSRSHRFLCVFAPICSGPDSVLGRSDWQLPHKTSSVTFQQAYC